MDIVSQTKSEVRGYTIVPDANLAFIIESAFEAVDANRPGDLGPTAVSAQIVPMTEHMWTTTRQAAALC